MIIDIPKKNRFYQSNDGELLGSVSSTFNIDPEVDRGKITIARRMGKGTDSTEEANLGQASSFAYFDNRYFASAGKIFVADTDTPNPDVAFEEDSATGAPTLTNANYELRLFNSSLYFIGASLLKKTGNYAADWTTVDSAPTDSLHSSTVFGDRLYFTEAETKIWSLTTADSLSTTGSYTLDISGAHPGHVISSIRHASDGIWLTTINTNGGVGKVMRWDGVTENILNNVYEIPDSSVKGLVIHEDRPHIVTGRGLVMRFNGSYFDEVARFPFYDKLRTDFAAAERFTTWTHDNAIAIIDNQVHIAISNNYIDEPTMVNNEERALSGVWCYDPEFGLYHKYAFYTESNTSSNNASQVDIPSVGSLFPAIYSEAVVNFEDAGKFIIGAQYYTDATNTEQAIFSAKTNYEEGDSSSFTTHPNMAWLVTSQIQSEQLQDSWQHILLTYEPFISAYDKIVVKARVQKEDFSDVEISWVSACVFTSADSAWADVKTRAEDDIYDEVTVIRGSGGGSCAHVQTITESGGTYTVTLDETITCDSGTTAIARIQRWHRLGDVTDIKNLATFSKFSTGFESTWIQYKIFMTGNGQSPTLGRIVSVSEPKAFYK
jgi:hypothetical protein